MLLVVLVLPIVVQCADTLWGLSEMLLLHCASPCACAISGCVCVCPSVSSVCSFITFAFSACVCPAAVVEVV